MAMFGSASVLLVALLARELGLRWPWLAASLFAIFPLTFRYATESRVYSQALFLSALATLLYMRAVKRPHWVWAIGYGLVLTAAIYTQPFAGSVGIAHVLWALMQREKFGVWLGAGALTGGVVSFLPWYFWSRDVWAKALGPNALHFSISAKTPLMLFRELAGAGYWGSGLLVILCAMALAHGFPASSTQRLLVLLIVVPILGVLAADALFDYFIAARQFLWVLPALAILAAIGAETYPRAGLAVAALFCAVGIVQSVKYFIGPHEDFQMAARALAVESRQGACVTVAPKDLSRLYEFFEPRLTTLACDSPRLVLAVTPYSTSEQRVASVGEITARGYRQEREAQVGGSTLVFFHQ
jgi:4-amino-4-deoxy-L-arabinose transferase-like glycosyltransferase